MESQIIAVANQLIQQGKKPTVALVRAKLTQRVAMPILLNTLNKIASLTPEQLNELSADTAKPAMKSPFKSNNLAELSAQVIELQNEVSQLKQQLSVISQQLGLPPQ
jgi:hypothetical protein